LNKNEKTKVKGKLNNSGARERNRNSNSRASRNTKSKSKSGKHVDNRVAEMKKFARKDSGNKKMQYDSEIEAGDARKNGDKPRRTKAEVKRNLKRIFALFLFILIAFLIMYTISLFKWYSIMKNVMKCQNSVILDSTGNVIAVIGENRIQKNVNFETVPDNLKNAYIAIEDKTFNKHIGINFKRTGGAILSYVTNKGAASYGGSTITQQLVKNITGENETKISRKFTEWDRAIKTEILFSKDDILEAYFNVIYVGPNVYGVEMGSKYYFDKDVKDLSLAECAFMAGLTHSPNSYNPFNGKNNSDLIKDRSITVLNVMLQEGYINESEYNNAVQEVNDGLKFKQGDVEPEGSGIYSYMADATINEVIQDLANDKNISTSFATNYLYLGGLKINSTQNSDIQKIIEDECSKNRYILKSNINKDATSQAAMVIIDQKKRICCGMCRWFRRKNFL